MSNKKVPAQGDIIYLPNKATVRKSGFKAAFDILALALILPFTGVERRRDKAIFRRVFRFSGAWFMRTDESSSLKTTSSIQWS